MDDNDPKRWEDPQKSPQMELYKKYYDYVSKMGDMSNMTPPKQSFARQILSRNFHLKLMPYGYYARPACRM